MKKLLFILLLLSYTVYSQYGAKISFVYVNDIGPGIGGGIVAQFNLNKYVSLYPGLDIWYVDEKEWYQNLDHEIFEVNINFDVKFRFPIKEYIAPYIGLGLLPVITMQQWDPQKDYINTGDIGVNVFWGCDFPIYKLTGIVEARLKTVSEYTVLKLSIGVMIPWKKN